MKTSIVLSSIGILIAGILGGLLISVHQGNNSSILGATQATPFYGSAVNSTVNVSTTPILVLSSNTGRNAAEVCSVATNGNVWLSVFAAGTTPTTTTGTSTYFASSTGRLLSPNSCYRIDANNLFTGVVWGISQSIASSSQTLSVMDLGGR